MGQKSVFVSGLTQVDTFNSALALNGAREQLGTIRQENEFVYKYVQFTGTTPVAAGDFVCYVAKGVDGALVQVDKANTNVGAGVAQAAVPAGTVQFGWIQIAGLATINTAIGGGAADGNAVSSVGAAAGTVNLMAASSSFPVGFAYDVAGKKILLDCPY